MLPKLNHPTFDVVLPTTKKTIKLRPFLVKEEKILLTAAASKDEGQMLNAIKQVLQNCIETPATKVEDFSGVDIDWAIVKLRQKSVGETLDVRILNNNCGNSEPCVDYRQEVNINLDDVKVIENPKHTKRIMIRDNIGVVMRYPSANLLKDIKNIKEGDPEFMYDIIIKCIESIFDEENVYNSSEVSFQELKDFVYEFSSTEFAKILDEFFETIPKVELDIKYVCDQCGASQEYKVQGFENFLVLG